MKKYKYPLSTSTWGDEEYRAIDRVKKSGKFTMGAEVQKFEEQFANYIGSKYSLMVNSGSSANLLMIASLFFKRENPLRRNDEIIVPALGWSTSYFPLQQYGLRIKFVDININTLNYDLVKLSKSITDKTKAILAINILGNPNDFAEIQKLIKNKDIILLEDNCEALGAEYKNKKTGTFGIIGTYSTFFSHHISTMEGGLVSTDNKELYQIMLCMRAHGWTRNLPQKNMITGEKSNNEFEELFRFVLPGYNLRPLEMSAAIGQEQLLKLPSFINMRRKNALFLQKVFNKHPYIKIQEEIDKSSWFGFNLTIKDPARIKRDYLRKKLIENGFEVRPVVTGNFTKQPVMNFLKADLSCDLRNSDYIDANSLFIGNNHFDMQKAITTLSQIKL
tara:strand:+ start:3513 stop:4682 length:1170 start_codon:yes stop_codon:yes gene_type:complete